MTDEDHALLRVAAAQLPLPGQRERAIGEMGMRPTQFWQRVNALLDDVRALEHDPITVNRLRRLRDRRSPRRLPLPAR